MSEERKAADHEDDQHRKFREALERKKSNRRSAPTESAANEGVGEAHNDKHVQTFRRKSI